MEDVCIHNAPWSTCYICNGDYLRDRARRQPKATTSPRRDRIARRGRSGTGGTPIVRPPEDAVHIYPDSEASFRKLNANTRHVRIIGMPLAKVITRILRLAPNVTTIYVGVRLELVAVKIQRQLARRGIMLIGSAR